MRQAIAGSPARQLENFSERSIGMAKVVDITEKLDFEERPEIIIKDVHIKINNSAETMLRIMGNFNGDDEVEAVINSVDLLFDKNEKKKLDKLKLSFKDFMKVVTEAMDIIRGDDGEETGEQ